MGREPNPISPTVADTAGAGSSTTARRGPQKVAPAPVPVAETVRPKLPAQPEEIGGPTGPEPTRYGDWERAGRCTDF
jgi:hypothetical protein